MVKIVNVRVTEDVKKIIAEMKADYPDLYRNTSDVMRAGVFALKRWKEQDALKRLESYKK